MSIQSIISSTLLFLSKLSKKSLLEIIENLRQSYVKLESENKALQAEVARLKLLEKEQKVKQVNLKSNKPSSKQGEWELKGVGNDGEDKKKGRGKTGRKGSGNRRKNKSITSKEVIGVEKCFYCGEDLSEQPILKTANTRVIEDIPNFPITTEVIEIVQQKKYCSCQKVTTARTDKALLGADIGINTSVQLVYMWIALCLPTTRITSYLKDIFTQKLSTAGVSQHLIKISEILKVVQEEILSELKQAAIIHADETGWRVNGKKWWLWVIGNSDYAYYTIDKSRGKDVVRKMLGEIFMGVLVVDGWKAYLSLECEKQTCMAHLLRKIRNLYAAFPKLRSVYKFYIQLRKILRDGQQLQSQRSQLVEGVFKRKLAKLHSRLDDLLLWSNPNDILADIIKKVKNQRPRILTFVEHDNVPCHNNFGEYLIRIGVLKRKVSFGSKSAKGANAYAVLLSVYTTCKLQGIPFLDFIKKSLQHYTQTGKPLLIKEYISKHQKLAA